MKKKIASMICVACLLAARGIFAQQLEIVASPHGMTTDGDGNIGVINDEKRAGIDGIPKGAANVVVSLPMVNHIMEKSIDRVKYTLT